MTDSLNKSSIISSITCSQLILIDLPIALDKIPRETPLLYGYWIFESNGDIIF